MNGYINWRVQEVGGEIELTGFTGSTAWGLVATYLPDEMICSLVLAGAVDFRSVALDWVGTKGWRTWLCDAHLDEIAEDYDDRTIGDEATELRTTSYSAAQGLCACCQAERAGLPGIMDTRVDMEALSGAEAHYRYDAQQWTHYDNIASRHFIYHD